MTGAEGQKAEEGSTGLTRHSGVEGRARTPAMGRQGSFPAGGSGVGGQTAEVLALCRNLARRAEPPPRSSVTHRCDGSDLETRL